MLCCESVCGRRGQVCKGLKENCVEMAAQNNAWLRLIVEKPFGMDLASSEELAERLGALFPEEQLYRIDHYLGKELMQNMLVLRCVRRSGARSLSGGPLQRLPRVTRARPPPARSSRRAARRFANQFIQPTWNRNFISNIQICFKEPFGTDGRGGYFDQFGIIRDVMQNHLLQARAATLLLCWRASPARQARAVLRLAARQVLALLAMEQPVSLAADDIRDEKVKVLRSLAAVSADETVLGQYTAAGSQAGYLDDPTVPKGSRTPTFASCILRIHNERCADRRGGRAVRAGRAVGRD